MFSFFYNSALFVLGLFTFPKLLWQWLVVGKYRASIKERLGLTLPQLPSDAPHPIIWIHTVSVGETRAVIPLYKKIRRELPIATIVVSSVTETGHAEALKSLPDAKAHFFLPLDFSWVIRKVVQNLRPDVLILVESDFWYHLLSETKKSGCNVVLVNGKISERSAKRFSLLKFFAKKLFSQLDVLCVQSQRFKDRFLALGIPSEKIKVSGNLKLDAVTQKLSPEQLLDFKNDLGISPQDCVLVIGSTHDPEEDQLLDALQPVWEILPQLKALIVPRHPERFDLVAKLIQQKDIPYLRYSKKEQKTGNERVILIDTMGLLHKCYQLADLAIVAGSFTDKVGGHNIFEPVECGVPVLFGPHMFGQPDLTEIVLNGKAGIQTSLQDLPSHILNLLQNSAKHKEISQAAVSLSQDVHGVTQRTWDAIFPFIKLGK